MRKAFILIVIILMISNFVLCGIALAQDPLKKLGRGVSNLCLGWVEIFTTVEDTGKSDGIVAAVSYGLLKGFAKGIQRMAVGAYETITFPVPIPKDYKPILTNPEFVLGKEAKE